MSVHYKFKSALEYDTITFDGLHISVKDLKNAIIQQKRIGKSTDFDLQVTNAQTKEVYNDENALIPKNTSLLIARIPTATQTKPKQWEGYGGDSTPPMKTDEAGPISKATDLSCLDAPEDDKIKAMMSQSTQDYDPSNYQKIRGANQMGAVPPTYRCYKCHQTGHWIKDCTFGQGTDNAMEIKKSTGIPRSFMVPVVGPEVPGAMMTPNGSYAVPALDHQAYNFKPTPVAPIEEIKPDIPEDLLCSICTDLLTDAVMIPCCGNSFCDECLRSCLLESEDHECPDCHEKDISPGTLIPNRFLRKSVATFKNTTGYVKKTVFRPQLPPKETILTLKENVTSEPLDQADNCNSKSDNEEKTIISEADSTENARNKEELKNVDANDSGKSASENEPLPEGPPGVSPKGSPKLSHISKRVGNVRDRDRSDGRSRKHRSQENSPKRRNTRRRSPTYDIGGGSNEERPGTPTVDEPGMGSNNYQYNNGPVSGIAPMMSLPPMQGPPPNIGGGPYQPPYPAAQGPLPNFRLPPPGTAPPYLASGPFSNPPRPMFDSNRPPMGGPPPFSSNYPPGSRSHHRDFSDRRMRTRTPPGVIDDPLAAFNRMLREKDERERRAKQRQQRRTYSRSRSRSRSFSPRSPRRLRSRSPRRRSRSRSFSISRSRSRSYSGSFRGGSPPPYRDRDFSPRHSPRRGPPPARYRSPIRSPPRRFKDNHPQDRGRDREYPRDRGRDADRDREYRFYDNYDDRGGVGRPKAAQWGQAMPLRPPAEAYYNPPPPEMNQPLPPYHPNRYQPRDYPPFMNKNDPHMPVPHSMTTRKYDDIAPPGVEEPPVPGMENTPRIEDRYEKPSIVEPVETKERNEDRSNNTKSRVVEREHERTRTNDKDSDRNKNEREVNRKSDRNRDRDVDRKRRYNRRSRTVERRSVTPRKRSKSREKESPDKHKKKRRDDSSDKEKSDRDKKKDHSDDEKAKRNKERKKKKEKEKAEKKKRRDKKEKHRREEKEKKHRDDTKESHTKTQKQEQDKRGSPQKEPEHAENQNSEQNAMLEDPQPGLYDDVFEDHMEKVVIDVYDQGPTESTPEMEPTNIENKEEDEETIEEGELEASKDYEDSEKDILELHSNDIDLKTELDSKNEMLAALPEKSKWEVEEDMASQSSPKESKHDYVKLDKSGKVTNEVLKRAENAIFAKAINAIRPIEIKKISGDRAKFYSGEKETVESVVEIKKPVIVQSVAIEHKKIEAPPVKLPVKERLGIKVIEPVKIIRLDRSLSPFSRRTGERNYGPGERRVEIDDPRRMDERIRRDVRIRDRRDNRRESHRNRRDLTTHKRDERKNRSRSKTRKESEKKRRSRSSSDDKKDKAKRRDKRIKKEKTKKKDEKDDKPKDSERAEEKPKTATDKRKPTLDEANFEPDYDLESESDKDDKNGKNDYKNESSSSESSSSSSEEERKRKKHRKHKKKKSKKDTSSSSSDSESDSSDEERERKKRKHKKKLKKKKKTKHK